MYSFLNFQQQTNYLFNLPQLLSPCYTQFFSFFFNYGIDIKVICCKYIWHKTCVCFNRFIFALLTRNFYQFFKIPLNWLFEELGYIFTELALRPSQSSSCNICKYLWKCMEVYVVPSPCNLFEGLLPLASLSPSLPPSAPPHPPPLWYKREKKKEEEKKNIQILHLFWIGVSIRPRQKIQCFPYRVFFVRLITPIYKGWKSNRSIPKTID